jgi:formiminoglutamate deiminase
VPTTHLFFDHALLPAGWAQNIRLTHENGVITGVTPGPQEGAERHAIALPGLPNLHSHTFQRAMAGLAEYRGPAEDNFWSWREQMYRFALKMSPEDVEATAAQAFAEMLESGFTSVAEFHYLHHDPDGKPYENIAEMAERIAAAAALTGIQLVLLPVFYAHASFGGLPPTPGQRRFITTLDSFATLHAKCQSLAPTGIAPHSLRAVTPEQLQHLITLAQTNPFHLHISEQTKEVEDCLAWSNQRPVDYLLANFPVAKNWCLIHATHVTPTERAALEATSAVAGLCPITEANLGDGIFPTADFSGPYGIGTDSNIFIDAPAELRQLEYAQRLSLRQRNVLAKNATGDTLWLRATTGGAQALGIPSGLTPGAPASFVTLDTAALGPAAANPQTALNAALFAARRPAIDCVWSQGQKRVENGRHIHAGTITQKFHQSLKTLL